MRIQGNGGGQLGTPSSTALQWNHNRFVSFPSGSLADIQNPDGNLRVNRHGIMFGGANAAGKEANSAQISAGVHGPGNNFLDIVGMGNNSSDRRVRAWAEAGFQINGPVILNGGWSIDTSDGQFRLKHNGEQKFVMHTSGKGWIQNGVGFAGSNWLLDGNNTVVGIRSIGDWAGGQAAWSRNL